MYKVGQKVVCHDASGRQGMVVGHVYTVSSMMKAANRMLLTFEERDASNYNLACYDYRVRPMTESEYNSSSFDPGRQPLSDVQMDEINAELQCISNARREDECPDDLCVHTCGNQISASQTCNHCGQE